jgi:hypothetical protein
MLSGNTEETLIVALVLLIVGLFFVYSGFKKLKRLHAINNTPTSKLRSAAQGYVEVIGRAESLDSKIILGKLTHKPCLWYSFEIEKYSRNGKHSSWSTVESGQSDDVFSINDTTGRCNIDPKGADITVHSKEVWRGSQRSPHKTTTGVMSFLNSGSYRYTEKRLHVNDPLYALGHLQTLNHARHRISDKMMEREVINEWKKDFHKLIEKYDTNNDGELDLQEWKQVQDDAKPVAQARKITQQAAPDINIIHRPPMGDLPYILSTKAQSSLGKHYQFGVFTSFSIGALGSISGLYLILNSL